MPVATIIGAIITAVGTGIGAGVNAKQVKDAKNEASMINTEQTAKTEQQNRLAYMDNKQQMSNNNRLTNLKINQSHVDMLQNVLNTNIGLKERVAKLWSR